MVEINSHHFPAGDSLVQLLETDVAGVLPEALTAHVQVVLPDETVLVTARAAVPGPLSVLAGAREPDVVVNHFSISCRSESSNY